MAEGDPTMMARAFAAIGWTSKTEPLFERYLREQHRGDLEALLAFADQDFAGYLTVNWRPSYPPLADTGIPEIQDLNVLPALRRRGIASRLLDEAEELAGAHTSTVAIGVGLHPGYNAAQRLYVLRGYVPDGNGVTVRDRFVHEGQTVVLNDELVLHLLKSLAGGS
jgi:GNAT superfamily N-acetyltransferase